jgi:hypothetical protein
MNIIAHSIVPANPIPYMHLGYTSATPYNTAVSTFSFVFIWCAIAYYAWKKSIAWGIFCLLMALISCCFSIYAYKESEKAVSVNMVKKKTKISSMITKSQAEFLYNEVITPLYKNGKEIPNSSDKLALPPDYKNLKLNDGWGNPFKISKKKDKGLTHFYLTSSGPDETFETNDDIVTEFQGKSGNIKSNNK